MIELTAYGYHGSPDFPDGTIPARVSASHRDRYELICAYGACGAHLKRGTDFPDVPTTGDYVRLKYNPAGDGVIASLLPRKTGFVRLDSFTGRAQAVAANFETVLLTSSLNHDFNPRRLERYLSLARASGAQPVILLTKLDIAEDAPGKIASARAIANDVPVFAVSAAKGEGLSQLAPYVRPGETIALLGSSGVGKSTLVNALSGAALMKVSAIREDDARGRHTTTHRQLILLESGALFIDTPGMRELGMWDADAGVAEAFEDLENLASGCRFRDCTHTREPGCAILRAVEEGTVDQKRVRNYLTLREESARSASKAEILRRKQEKFKAIAKSGKANQKNRY